MISAENYVFFCYALLLGDAQGMIALVFAGICGVQLIPYGIVGSRRMVPIHFVYARYDPRPFSRVEYSLMISEGNVERADCS